MARKRGKRNFSRYMAGSIDVDIALSTLGAKVVASSGTPGVVVDTTRVSSIKCVYALSGYTAEQNSGPIMIGVCHPDYSNAEIEAWIENTGGWDIGNMIQREVGTRRMRIVGIFPIPAAVGEAVNLNDGKPIRTKLNWVISEGEGLRFFVYNSGTAPVGVTDPNARILGHANLWAQ